ncbi:hypothetical protein GPA22_20090 [Aromatoleum toluvorans]|uniref:Type I restriction modification DNA specificity domain-containing protein n=1 Tax=Aromatoleum toluvorans TaxID=92002 RepID=A0ABX1Q2U9_9RHOO|nr:restriction endonuclease subunit S [Aromatoleum toluvorans]NMG46023.1 hypothetical protein [Aromatoleum toluvorans]
MGGSMRLPSCWVQVTVADLGKVVSGGTPSTKDGSYWGGTISWISPSDLTGYSNKYIAKGAKSISEAGLKASSAAIMPRGSVHFSSRAPIGYVAISSCDMTTNQGFKSVVPAKGVFNEYLYYYFKGAKQLAESMATGTTFKELSGSAFSKLPVPLPPTGEQHRIVAKIEELFSELDKGIESLKTAQAQLKVYRQALLKHAFEGKLTAQWRTDNPDQLETADALLKRIQQERAERYRQQLADWEARGKQGSKPKAPKPLEPLSADELADLPELPEGWGWVKVSSLGTLGTGVTPLKGRTDFYAGGVIPWVTSGALNESFVTKASDYVTQTALQETNLRIYPKHTLLVALYGEGKTRGKCSELLIEATTNQAIAAIVLEGMAATLRPYVKWFFQKNYGDIRLKSSGGVQPNLNLGIIENTAVPLCPLAEAKQLVETIEYKLSEVDQLDQTITSSLQQAEALRQSILKKAFSGQLVPQDPQDEPASVLLERIRAEKSNGMKARKREKSR